MAIACRANNSNTRCGKTKNAVMQLAQSPCASARKSAHVRPTPLASGCECALSSLSLSREYTLQERSLEIGVALGRDVERPVVDTAGPCWRSKRGGGGAEL